MIKPKIMVVIGTRPEAIKMVPVIIELNRHEAQLDTFLVTSGQHKEMVNNILEVFGIKQDLDLNLMTVNQTLSDINSRVLTLLGPILKTEKPNLLMVHGDTTTAMAASLCGFYNNIDVAHVEAGLRTFDVRNPYPEELNRRVIDMVSALLFAPTAGAENNLLKEGVKRENIFVTGNTGIDTLFLTIDRDISFSHPALKNLDWENKKIVLLTTHRRENFGPVMKKIHEAIRETVQKDADVLVIFPVHPNPNVKEVAKDVWGRTQQAVLTEPLSYTDMIGLLKKSHVVITDSGGVQEEAASLNTPVLILRSLTERPEGIEHSSARLVGTNPDDIKKEITKALGMPKSIIEKKNVYGDGHAAQRIVEVLINNYVK